MNKGLFKFYPSLAAVAFCSLTGAVSLLTACSDNTSTAGVLTETESGQTASLTISVNTNLEVGDPSEISSRPRVALMRTANDRSEIIDSAVTDTNNEVTFKNVPYNDFSIVAMGMDTSGTVTFGNIITDKILESKELLNDTGFVETHLEINLYETAKIRLNAAALEIAPGDSVCITGTLSCGVYDKTAQESGYISIENIPASTYSDSYVDYDQVEIIHDGAARKDTVYWRVFPGDDRTANANRTDSSQKARHTRRLHRMRLREHDHIRLHGQESKQPSLEQFQLQGGRLHHHLGNASAHGFGSHHLQGARRNLPPRGSLKPYPVFRLVRLGRHAVQGNILRRFQHSRRILDSRRGYRRQRSPQHSFPGFRKYRFQNSPMRKER